MNRATSLIVLSAFLALTIPSLPVKALDEAETLFPVLLQGSDAPDLLGKNITELSLFTCQESRIRPILFQVDEYNAEGRIVPNVFKGEPVRDETPGVIDENDMIIFMVRDIGEPCAPEQLARAQGKVVEIPFSGNGGRMVYALVGAQLGAIAASPLRYDQKTDTVTTPAYVWGYSVKMAHLFDRLQFRDYRGAAGDHFDRLKVRMKARSLGNLMTINVNEDDIESTLRGVKAGPVRIVRDVPVSVTPVPGFKISAVVEFIHYERMWDAQVRFRLPTHAAMFLSTLDVRFVIDFNDTRGMRFVTKTEPQGLPIEGNSTDGPVPVDMGSEPWQLLTGQGLTAVVFVNYDRELKLSPTAYYMDNRNVPDPPEETPGCSPCTGFELNRWENLKAQWYSFGAQIFLASRFPEGGGSGIYKRYQTRPKPIRSN